MVWFHGSGFVQGSGSLPSFVSEAALAAKTVPKVSTDALFKSALNASRGRNPPS
jgi:hypothetical protein